MTKPSQDHVEYLACRFCRKAAPPLVIKAEHWAQLQTLRAPFRGKNMCKACCLERGIDTKAAFDGDQGA